MTKAVTCKKYPASKNYCYTFLSHSAWAKGLGELCLALAIMVP
jgi:hypothetical protein